MILSSTAAPISMFLQPLVCSILIFFNPWTRLLPLWTTTTSAGTFLDNILRTGAGYGAEGLPFIWDHWLSEPPWVIDGIFESC